MDTGSSSRNFSEVRNNVAFENYDSVFGTNQIVMLIYLGGYKMKVGSTGVYVKVSVEILSGTTH